jgi:deazaflavin-dependent oxidoreductase (nitroreductase family)
MVRAMKLLSLAVGLTIIGMAALGAIFIGGIRAKWPPVVDRVRRMNRSFFASEQLKSAGGPGAYAGALRHTGRKSGNNYVTPVGIKRHGDSFVIAMVYGRRTDWVRNIIAAGSAVVELDGETYSVDLPEIVPSADVADAFTPGDQRLNRLLAIDECLQLHRVSPESE